MDLKNQFLMLTWIWLLIVEKNCLGCSSSSSFSFRRIVGCSCFQDVPFFFFSCSMAGNSILTNSLWSGVELLAGSFLFFRGEGKNWLFQCWRLFSDNTFLSVAVIFGRHSYRWGEVVVGGNVDTSSCITITKSFCFQLQIECIVCSQCTVCTRAETAAQTPTGSCDVIIPSSGWSLDFRFPDEMAAIFWGFKSANWFFIFSFLRTFCTRISIAWRCVVLNGTDRNRLGTTLQNFSRAWFKKTEFASSSSAD